MPTLIVLASVACFSRSICKRRGASNKSTSERRTTAVNVNNAIEAFMYLLDGLAALGARSRSRYEDNVTEVAQVTWTSIWETYRRAYRERRRTCLGEFVPSRMGCGIENKLIR